MGLVGGSPRVVVWTALVLLGMICSVMFPQLEAALTVGFYKNTCPSAEAIVKDAIKAAQTVDSGITADFVRMQFHDCFVRGCDASILLDSTPGNTAEKDSHINNPSLEGFDVIDAAKAKLEAACPGVVSCADIIAFAARDSVELAGGGHYDVPSGRRDGRVSLISEANAMLPPPTHNLRQLTSLFSTKGLNANDLVVLTGVHTLGKASCSSFDNRLYNFSSTASQDPSLNPTRAAELKKQCPGGAADAAINVPMDPLTPEVLDNNHFKNILQHKALFTSDQALLSGSQTAARVSMYARNPLLFRRDFAAAMVKMSRIGVLTGTVGEIRRNCKVVN